MSSGHSTISPASVQMPSGINTTTRMRSARRCRTVSLGAAAPSVAWEWATFPPSVSPCEPYSPGSPGRNPSSGSLPRRESADRDLRGSQSTRHLPSPNRAAVAVVAVLILGLIGLGARAVTGVLVEQARQGSTAGVPALPATSAPPSPMATAEPSPSKGTARRQAQNQAQAAGATPKVPKSGPGTYVLARLSGDPAGRTGTVVNFDVRREKGVPVDVSAAARTIQSVLNDRRSWRASDRWRFQLVSNSASADLHVYITTPATTDRLCAPLITRGEVSCQTDNRVVLNAKRWVSGAESYR